MLWTYGLNVEDALILWISKYTYSCPQILPTSLTTITLSYVLEMLTYPVCLRHPSVCETIYDASSSPNGGTCSACTTGPSLTYNNQDAYQLI